MKNNYLKQLKDGILTQNPVFVQLIGMCPVLGVTTSLENGIGMGIAATVVLMCSNMAISALRKFIPSKVRIAAFIVIIAGFVTIVDMVLKAFIPALASSLGIFIPLIVVNCIILARAEAFASKNPILPSAMDGLSMGLGFTFALSILGAVREILGKGTITVWGDFGFSLVDTLKESGINFQPAATMVSPAGGFLALGFVIATVQVISNRKKGAK